MALYVTKPVIIEAMQLRHDVWREITDWCHGRYTMGTSGTFLDISNGTESIRAYPGDWVVYVGANEWMVYHNTEFLDTFLAADAGMVADAAAKPEVMVIR
jgi:hypothetical protein